MFQVGKGESDVSKTKVLHMVINPEAEIHGQSEVQALRVRLDMHERHFGEPAEPSLFVVVGSLFVQVCQYLLTM